MIPTHFFLPNLVSNHLVIDFLLDHIGGAITFVRPVGLGVDERTLDCKFLLVLLIRKFLPWLGHLLDLWHLWWHLEKVTVDLFSSFFTMSSRLS